MSEEKYVLVKVPEGCNVDTIEIATNDGERWISLTAHKVVKVRAADGLEYFVIKEEKGGR